MLEVRDLRFAYGGGGFSLHIPELILRPGQSLGLGGPSGAGKTTVLKLLAGILAAQGGRVQIEGAVPDRAVRLARMGLVFQDFALVEYLTSWDNVLLPLRLTGRLQKDHEVRAASLLEAVEMAGHRDHLVSRLSQGERQRIAVVRALLHRPALLLADEPTSALDTRRRNLVAGLLQKELHEHGTMLVLVTHDLELHEQAQQKISVEAWCQPS
ncbi:ABC transporter ATP-binding protein [Verrucomicrobium spinosum]|uniref:ABC transporter ATP-binding protein n=1 Tax=Verrucomicrobium spinosum TaxID=2736 RepID=UPI0001744D8F|nr:ATP-binding cassette domain-containing protein [Verrucomicrobium spinosum]